MQNDESVTGPLTNEQLKNKKSGELDNETTMNEIDSSAISKDEDATMKNEGGAGSVGGQMVDEPVEREGKQDTSSASKDEQIARSTGTDAHPSTIDASEDTKGEAGAVAATEVESKVADAASASIAGATIERTEPAATMPETGSILSDTSSTTTIPNSSIDTTSTTVPLTTAASSTPQPLDLPPPSSSPAPPTTTTSAPAPVKKFQSSLAVNKKFLEKAGEKTKAAPEIKPAHTQIRPSPSPQPTSVSTSHPRLLTGKISLTMGSSSSGSAGANANSSTSTSGGPAGSTGSTPTSNTTWTKPAIPPPASTPSTSEDRAFPSARNNANRSSKLDAPWTRGQSNRSQELNFGASEFPTAAEAANAKAARAQAILEQMQSRDRAIQARAAAAARANANLLQGLDAFRGVHLDPNASHWDEMGDEDDNFLDDTIEFADGTQYKISEVAAAAAEAEAEKEVQQRNELREPSREEMGRLEAPLAPGDKGEEIIRREERFKDDYDRSYSRTNAPKTLYNAREGKLEPTPPSAGSARHPTAIHSSSSRRMSNDQPHHFDRSAPTARHDLTSPRLEKASLPPPTTTSAWGRVPPPANPASLSSAPGRSSSVHERALPPHLANAAPASRPPPAMAASRAPPVTAQQASSVAPPAVVPESVEDLEARQAREMHAAAERAKLRRQEEERERLAQVERARKKAAELEEKMKALAGEGTKKVESNEVEEKRGSGIAANTAGGAVESWRKPTSNAPNTARRLSTSIATPTPPVKQEPIRILAREPSTATLPQPLATPTLLKAPLEPQDRAWRKSEAAAGNNRQAAGSARAIRELPPHLQQTQQVSTQRAELPHLADQNKASGPNRLAPAPTILTRPLQASSTSPPAPVPAPAADSNSPTSPRRGGAKGQQRDPNQLDDLMSRVKNAMSPSQPAALKEAVSTTQDNPETVSNGSDTPKNLTPIIRLPGSQDAKGKKKYDVRTQAQARAETKRVSSAPAASQPSKPAFELREAQSLFDRTCGPRPPSPAPVWKRYTVALATHKTSHRPPPKGKVAAFNIQAQPSRVMILSWNPPIHNMISRRLSRDDMLHPKKYVKGVLQSVITVPQQRIERKTEIEVVIVDRSKPKPSTTEENSRAPTPAFDKGRSSTPVLGLANAKERLSDKDTWRRPPPIVKMNGNASKQTDIASAPPTTAVFDAELKTPTQTTPSEQPKPQYRSVTPQPRSEPAKSPLYATSSQIHQLSSAPSERSTFTGQLGGVEVEKTPRKSLAAPGAERTTPTQMEKAKASFDATPSVLSSPSSGWPGAKAHLSLSALDPMGSSLWAAPPQSEIPAHARSMSVPRVRHENSLEGLVDDDFPGVTIPTSLADLKTDEDSSPQRKASKGVEIPIAASALPNNEPRLRAAAPAFSSSAVLKGEFVPTEAHYQASLAGVTNYPRSASPSAPPPRFATMQRPAVAQQQAHAGLNPYSPSVSPHPSAVTYSPQTTPVVIAQQSVASYAQPLYTPAQQYATYSPVQFAQQNQTRVSYAPASASVSAYSTSGAANGHEYTGVSHQQQQAYFRAQAAQAALAAQQQGTATHGGSSNPMTSYSNGNAYSSSAQHRHAAVDAGSYGAVGGGMNRHVSHSAIGHSGGSFAYGGAGVHRNASASIVSSRGGEYGSYHRDSSPSHYSSASSPYTSHSISSASNSMGGGSTSFVSGPSPVLMPAHLQQNAYHHVPSGSVGSAFVLHPSNARQTPNYGSTPSPQLSSMSRAGPTSGHQAQNHASQGAQSSYRSQW